MVPKAVQISQLMGLQLRPPADSIYTNTANDERASSDSANRTSHSTPKTRVPPDLRGAPRGGGGAQVAGALITGEVTMLVLPG